MFFQETETIELKQVLNDSLQKEIVSFLNSFDGTIYIGVADDGCVVGVDSIDETQKRIADIITTQILPNPQEFIELGTKYVDGKNVVEIKVKKGDNLYYIKKYGRSSNGCYIRVGTSCRSMTEEQIRVGYEQHVLSNISILDIPSRKTDLTFHYLKMSFQENDLTVNEESFEKNCALKTSKNQYNLQAELLADNNDYSIKVVRFNGKTKADPILFRNEYGYKCLISAMRQAYEFCADVVNVTKTVWEGDIRKDIRLFDSNAFREVWYNACLHNDWIDGTPPAIYIFDDRMEIISTGGLPINLSKSDFFSGVSMPVNTVLARIFIQLGLIEQTGHGVPLVVQRYGKTVFEFLDHFLRVTIPFEYSLEIVNEQINEINVPVNVPVNAPVKLTNTAQQILMLIKENNSITMDELARKLRKDRKTISRNIKSLKDTGIVKRIGSDKSGYWEIIKK